MCPKKHRRGSYIYTYISSFKASSSIFFFFHVVLSSTARTSTAVASSCRSHCVLAMTMLHIYFRHRRRHRTYAAVGQPHPLHSTCCRHGVSPLFTPPPTVQPTQPTFVLSDCPTSETIIANDFATTTRNRQYPNHMAFRNRLT